MNKSQILKSAKEVLNIESKAINDLAKGLDDNFFKAIESIKNLKGKLIISGVGKSGNIAAKIAASFTSTGIPSVFLNPVDASHGDMGIVRVDDILIVLSNSGESHELSDLLDFAKKQSIKIISICSNKKSLLAKNSDINLILPPHKEADKLSTIPTTSTTMALALGDALCCCLLDLREFDKKAFKLLHPGGKIGKKLKTLSEIMDTDLPLIEQNSSIIDAVLEMTEKKYGCAVIIDNHKKIKGIITDGDLRRAIKKLNMSDKATSIMNKKPVTATPDLLISSAIMLMNKNSITSLLIVKKNIPIGIVNLKNCLENE
ncbi:KpsF/GutQ family sugar-phosphate isomerase [Alphaproteobacteria bacterium]|jgi:arabinose-5-phosphate isomerase|nr:KpsF/GutQ family sugar-phosphate isomerase [Alphaproteobacteria bacterium]